MQSVKFNNTYFALRHGESRANVKGVIVSHPKRGRRWWNTLTKNGRAQVAGSVSEATQNGILGEDTIIYSSPFARCRKTAKIAKKILRTRHKIIFDDRLRERWFGDWEGTGNANYQKVWDKDVVDPHHKEANVESANEVQERVAGLISELESKYSGKNILLVSHGDALQILQTFFAEQSASTHRSLPHLKVAEVRLISA